MITRIEIEHFKSIHKLDLELPSVCVLVGPNGSGKSNFVDAIRFVRDALRQGLDRAVTDRHGIESIRTWSPTKPYHVTIALTARTSWQHGRFSFTLGSAKGSVRVEREELDCTLIAPAAGGGGRQRQGGGKIGFARDVQGVVKILHPRVAGRIPDELRVARDELFLTSLWGRRFSHARDAFSDFCAYSIFPNTLRVPQKPGNEGELDAHGENFSTIFKALKRPRRRINPIDEIMEWMKLVLPNLEDITIHNVGGFLVPQFLVKESSGKRHLYNVSQVSDGTIRILGLLTALHQLPRPTTIALEEPEMTVHPGALAILADTIKATKQDEQVIITTHSPDLIDLFDPEQIFTVELRDGVSSIAPVGRIQIEAVRQNLFTLGELMSHEGLHP